MFDVTDFQKIGIGLTGFGVSFIFLGVLFFFDRGLLAIGNILFLCGLAFVIGLERTFRFFFQKHKLKGSAFFFGGIAIVLFGWPFVGICVETYGFILLFSSAISPLRSRLSRSRRAGIIVASSEVEERKAGGEVEGVSSTKRVSLTGSSVAQHPRRKNHPANANNNNQHKKNAGRFEIFTNIFKKKNKEKDSEPSSASSSVVSKKNLADGFDYRENVLDVEGEDKETSIVPTVTCSATAAEESSSEGFVVRESNSQASVISSQPIEIPLPSKSPMGHSPRYSDQEPFLPGSGYDNATIEHYKYLSESEPIGDSSISPVVSPRVRSLHHDMQALRISRQDNPYLQQKLERTSISNDGEDAPFSSPRKQEQEKLVDDTDEEDSEMDEGIISLHQHLIRSPPPHFPPNVTKFRFPDTRSVAPASSPLIGKQLTDSLYDPTTGRSATPAYALDPNLPVTTTIAKVSNLNASQKEKMPLLPIDEKFVPPPPQNEATGEYRRWEATNKIATTSQVVFDREQMTPRNRQQLGQIGGDLNPILIKSGVDALDPGMRQVLEFQKHKIVHETGLRLPEPLGTTAIGVCEVTVPVITGRLSAEGTAAAGTSHYVTPRSSISSCCSYNLKSSQTLQPMAGAGSVIQAPSTAPTFPTSPSKPMTLPAKSVGMTSPPAALLSPLPPLGATYLPSNEPPVKSTSEGVFEPSKKLLAQ